jgi:hypothetical protein
MLTIRVPNVNHAYPHGLTLIASEGVPRPSRYGNVIVAPESVCTTYYNPKQRVLFHAERDANPFFHLFEALWMLTGAQDVECLKYLLPRMAEFSDNGASYHGAYGYRWRKHFGFDQINEAILQLRTDTTSRRVMIQIWDAREDLGTKSKDIPCNTMLKLEADAIDPTRLNMVLFNRSNDVIWGAYGANAVQFSMLLEYIATMAGMRVGRLEQISSNFHVYEDAWQKARKHIGALNRVDDPYTYMENRAVVFPLISDAATFDEECLRVVDSVRHTPHYLGTAEYANDFFRIVCDPMARAYALYRGDDPVAAMNVLQGAIDSYGSIDWLVAGFQWMERRAAKRGFNTNV